MRTITLAASVAILSIGCGTSGELPEDAAVSAAAETKPPAGAVDACRLVPAADASALFGERAERETGVTVTDPNMVGECIWEHESATGSHQLQVRVWRSPQYYAPPEDEFTKPLDVGERGYVRVHAASGVDLAWVQDGRALELSYFTVGGPGMPKATDRVDAVRRLARTASGRL